MVTPHFGRIIPGNDTVYIVMEAGRTPGPVWASAENLLPTGTRSPDRPACAESLHRLNCRDRKSILRASVNAMVSRQICHSKLAKILSNTHYLSFICVEEEFNIKYGF